MPRECDSSINPPGAVAGSSAGVRQPPDIPEDVAQHLNKAGYDPMQNPEMREAFARSINLQPQ